jgi:hypothetical protein
MYMAEAEAGTKVKSKSTGPVEFDQQVSEATNNELTGCSGGSVRQGEGRSPESE